MTTPTLHESEAQRLLADVTTPRWLKEVDRFLPIKSQFLLYGNIRDRFPLAVEPEQLAMCAPQELLVDYLALKDYKHFFVINPLQGIAVAAPSSVDPKQHSQQTISWLDKAGATGSLRFEPNANSTRWHANASFALAVEFVERIVQTRTEPCCIFFTYMMGQIEQGQTKETDPFVRALILSYESKPLKAHYNTVFWLCDRDNDLPPWFTLNNPRIRSIALSKPDGKLRALVANHLMGHLSGWTALSPELRARTLDDLSAQTNGLLLNDLEAIVRFFPAQRLEVTEIAEAARRYKLGVTEDPWRRIDRPKLQSAEALIRKRVKGQEAAITKALDIIRRAIVGLAGAQAARGSGKPKGVLFFAGPTGVGKTELAKSITEALFGDETAYIRFDMSEFNHEHSDQRLIGAPPGYVGYEAGGELTAAIRERPFSVVLFDEIEKAHPRILDKFLQILDDGQLTSGKGERVYFSDAILVFTSNLGMDSVAPGDEYETLEKRLRQAIGSYFREKLNRPELLNRIGNNIVVFDFIREEIALRILSKMVGNVFERVKETQRITLTMSGYEPTNEAALPSSGTAYETLYEHCKLNLSDGGRGIGNLIESVLINPLSRALWDSGTKEGDTVRIDRIYFQGTTPIVELML